MLLSSKTNNSIPKDTLDRIHLFVTTKYSIHSVQQSQKSKIKRYIIDPSKRELSAYKSAYKTFMEWGELDSIKIKENNSESPSEAEVLAENSIFPDFFYERYELKEGGVVEASDLWNFISYYSYKIGQPKKKLDLLLTKTNVKKIIKNGNRRYYLNIQKRFPFNINREEMNKLIESYLNKVPYLGCARSNYEWRLREKYNGTLTNYLPPKVWEGFKDFILSIPEYSSYSEIETQPNLKKKKELDTLIQKVLDTYEIKEGAITKGRDLWEFLKEISGNQGKAKILKDELQLRYSVKKVGSTYSNIQKKSTSIRDIGSVEDPEISNPPVVLSVSKDDFDKRAKYFISSYRIYGKGLLEEIKTEIYKFISQNLCGNYDIDICNLNRLSPSQKDIYNQYKAVIIPFMDTYKPIEEGKTRDEVRVCEEKDNHKIIKELQVQIKSLTSVLNTLTKELERLTSELNSLD